MSMSSHDYHFVTHWRVTGTVEDVSAIIEDLRHLPRWWPAVYLAVDEIDPGDARGIGRTVDFHTKGWLPYTLRWRARVIESRSPYGFTIKATGDFDGRGIWTFRQDSDEVDVVFDWKLRAEKPLIRQMSGLLKPLFERNHVWAMARGEESLRLELARRSAKSDDERAALAGPPGPTSNAVFAAAAAGVAVVGAGLWMWVRRGRSKSL
jgi:hypothetical protein